MPDHDPHESDADQMQPADDEQMQSSDADQMQPSDTDQMQSSDTDEHRERHDADAYVGEYDKLVRDDIPSVVRDDGNEPVTRTVEGAEYRRYLAAKLVEEAHEYADAVDTPDASATSNGDESDDEVLDELADVHAVLDAIVDASTYPQGAIDARRREKTTERGAFADGIVLERIDARD